MLDKLKAARARWTKVRWGEDETTVRDAGDDLNDALSEAIAEIEHWQEHSTELRVERDAIEAEIERLRDGISHAIGLSLENPDETALVRMSLNELLEASDGRP